ncbi:hypothetical protein Tco_0211517 [Tanacetum coccineum]
MVTLATERNISRTYGENIASILESVDYEFFHIVGQEFTKSGLRIGNGLKQGHYAQLKPDVTITSADLAYYGSIGILKEVDLRENLKKVAVSGKRFYQFCRGDSDRMKAKNGAHNVQMR